MRIKTDTTQRRRTVHQVRYQQQLTIIRRRDLGFSCHLSVDVCCWVCRRRLVWRIQCRSPNSKFNRFPHATNTSVMFTAERHQTCGARAPHYTVSVVSQWARSSINARVYTIKVYKMYLSSLGLHKLSVERYFHVLIRLKFNLGKNYKTKQKHLVTLWCCIHVHHSPILLIKTAFTCTVIRHIIDSAWMQVYLASVLGDKLSCPWR